MKILVYLKEANMKTRGNFALVLFVGVMLVAGSTAAQQSPTTRADSHKPSCNSTTHGKNEFRILGNQTYALCAASTSFVFNKVAYTNCDIEYGDSIMLAFGFDDDQDVCTVNEEGVKNGYMVSTFSPPPSVLEGGDKAVYTCPSGSDGAYAQCGGGICFKSTRGHSFPGFDKPLAKDEIICSCPITTQKPSDPVGYQIVGPYPCQQTFFDNCKSTTANSKTGSTLYVGAPTGTADLLTFLLTGSVPKENKCSMSPN
jgi:hypothetical protein